MLVQRTLGGVGGLCQCQIMPADNHPPLDYSRMMECGSSVDGICCLSWSQPSRQTAFVIERILEVVPRLNDLDIYLRLACSSNRLGLSSRWRGHRPNGKGGNKDRFRAQRRTKVGKNATSPSLDFPPIYVVAPQSLSLPVRPRAHPSPGSPLSSV